jgi:acetoacetyl-CoA synthetase
LVTDSAFGTELFGKQLWRPSDQRVQASHYARFAARCNLSPSEVQRWSESQPTAFWDAVWDYTGMIGEKSAPGSAPKPYVRGATIREDRFFEGARLNLATNLLAKTGPTAAVIAHNESGERHVLSWDELRSQVGACAAALVADGVRAGDRVVAYLPHGVEAIVTMIATVSLGATFSTASPDFGTQGVLDRFAQIDPVVMFACSGYSYGGKRFDTTDRVAAIEGGLSTLRRTVHTDDGGFATYLAPHLGASVPDDLYSYDQPWYVLYSSGTTGKPKCFVHRAGGVLLQHRKEQMLHCNVSSGDVVLYFTTTGWMMWNWLVSALATGATVVCVDGSPAHPTLNRLFDLVDQEGVTLLGMGAKFIDTLRKEGARPKATHDLVSLQTLCATGSPLVAEGFAYVYDAIKTDVHLASISGGTDLCGCFVGGNPTQPVFAGEIQDRMLGMAVDVWSDEGNSLAESPGSRGELVCTQSFPSMPLGFWGDDDGSRYTAAYFARFGDRDVWAHGDFAAFTDSRDGGPQGFVIHGRSDATLNPGGVRIGTAEITRQVEHEPTIAESLVFGQDWDTDTRIVLLVRMVPGHVLTDEHVASLKRRIRANCSPRHVPAVVLAVDDLPRTRSGKLTELAVADAVNGREVRNSEAMANPEALWAIAARPELRA